MSEVFTVIPEACEAAAVKLVSVIVKRFADVSSGRRRPVHSVFSSRVSVWLLMKRAMLRAVFFLFSHSSVSPCVGSLSEVFNDTGETRKDAHDTGHG